MNFLLDVLSLAAVLPMLQAMMFSLLPYILTSKSNQISLEKVKFKVRESNELQWEILAWSRIFVVEHIPRMQRGPGFESWWMLVSCFVSRLTFLALKLLEVLILYKLVWSIAQCHQSFMLIVECS